MSWLESHPVTVDLIKWILLILGAWAVGVFKILRRFTLRPSVALYDSPGFCFLEDYKTEEGADGRLSVFIVNPSIRNPSFNSYEIERITLGYKCRFIFRSFRQNLLPISFPQRPKQQHGTSIKALPVFFTRFGDQFDDGLTTDTIIDERRVSSGYIMFISRTWGSWMAENQKEEIKIKLSVKTVGAGKLKFRGNLRTTSDISELKEFCPGLYELVSDKKYGNAEKH